MKILPIVCYHKLNEFELRQNSSKYLTRIRTLNVRRFVLDKHTFN